MDGMRKIVASSTNALTTVKNTIAAENENSLGDVARHGHLSTIPADTPAKILKRLSEHPPD